MVNYLVSADETNVLCEIQRGKTPCKLSLAPIGADKTAQVVIDTDSVRERYEIRGIFIA